MYAIGLRLVANEEVNLVVVIRHDARNFKSTEEIAKVVEYFAHLWCQYVMRKKRVCSNWILQRAMRLYCLSICQEQRFIPKICWFQSYLLYHVYNSVWVAENCLILFFKGRNFREILVVCSINCRSVGFRCKKFYRERFFCVHTSQFERWGRL